MKCYANLYRDAAGRGFLDGVFDTSDAARQQKSETSDSGKLEHVSTVAIIMVSDTQDVPHELMKSALLNATIVPQRSSTYRQNFVIHANPYQPEETNEWAVGVTIVYDRGADTRIDEYTDGDARFATREEAVSQCFVFGRKIIDEQLAE